ncbi:hypothetical protein [Peribacillus aracenensis]|nr:hypothetical protein [Peribacillus sp. BBB004]
MPSTRTTRRRKILLIAAMPAFSAMNVKKKATWTWQGGCGQLFSIHASFK